MLTSSTLDTVADLVINVNFIDYSHITAILTISTSAVGNRKFRDVRP